MIEVLILSPQLLQSRAIARFLKKTSQYIIIGGILPEENKYSNKSIYTTCIRVSPETLAKYKLVIPTGTRSTKWLASIFPEITIGSISYPSKNLEIFSKIIQIDIARSLNIPIPKEYKEINKIKNFPVFYKEKIEQGGKERGIVRNSSELKQFRKYNSIFFQEYITSPHTHAVCFMAKNGEIISSFTHKEIISCPRTGGSAVIIKSVTNDEILCYTKKLLNELCYSGWGMAEYKYCPKRDKYVFMEINAKFWSSIEFSFVNQPEFLKLLFNIEIPIQPCKSAVFPELLFQLSIKDIFLFYKYIYKYKPLCDNTIFNTAMLATISKVKHKVFLYSSRFINNI